MSFIFIPWSLLVWRMALKRFFNQLIPSSPKHFHTLICDHVLLPHHFSSSGASFASFPSDLSTEVVVLQALRVVIFTKILVLVPNLIKQLVEIALLPLLYLHPSIAHSCCPLLSTSLIPSPLPSYFSVNSLFHPLEVFLKGLRCLVHNDCSLEE